MENQIDTLFENLNEGIITYDQYGIIKDNNSNASRLIDIDAQNLTGEKIKDIIPIKENELFLSDAKERVLKIRGNDIIII